MIDLLASLGNWNWLILGLVLVGLELLTPGVFLFWLGLAAFLVGALSFVVDPTWQTQLLMFAVFAAAAVPLWRRMARRESSGAASPFLNRRAEGSRLESQGASR